MPYATVRGVNINYQVLGNGGPWVALSPGGRRDMSGIELLAGEVAKRGHRVVIFDRRNTGASDVVIDGNESEYEIWADDVHELLGQLGALPAVVGGSSSGCRTSLLFALRHPESVRALLLWRVTGGRFACERLAEEYYGQFITAARSGGMAAVCDMDHWKERIAARPANRDVLMKMEPQQFHSSHVALARIFSQRRRSARHRRHRGGFAIDPGTGLHRPRQRSHPWTANRRDSRPAAANQ